MALLLSVSAATLLSCGVLADISDTLPLDVWQAVLDEAADDADPAELNLLQHRAMLIKRSMAEALANQHDVPRVAASSGVTNSPEIDASAFDDEGPALALLQTGVEAATDKLSERRASFVVGAEGSLTSEQATSSLTRSDVVSMSISADGSTYSI
eukprot:TRINITY_DN57444_c0_g1_i1.p1 TRINITY_DN57444_c0_g1~~TRINITY_DN57444_c0_g1_i1.p1  ORF type:complete len:155 (+),score=39.97 TRINITY_DN57444_c0_g1_i1:85-549(+)